MKVLVIVPDVGCYGGTSRFLERLLDIHARRGFITTLLVPAGQCNSMLASLASRYSVELVQSTSRADTDTVPFITPFYDFLFSWRTLLTSRPDLIVVSTGDPGRLSISFYFPIPVLYILHSEPERRFRLLPRLYMKIGSMLNNLVMTVSNAAADSVSDLMGIPQNRIEVVYNSCGVGTGRNESDTSIVLTAGHLVAYKNTELWFEVVCRVVLERPDTVFVWLGDGEQLDDIREKVTGMSMEKRILLPGYVKDPSTWYAQAQIYFQPSLRESHGIAVLEAMSHGLPCVVADTGGLPESVVDGETGYVCPPKDETGFAECIIELLDDSVLRERMGCAGYQRVKKCFSEDIQENKIMVLYDRLMNNEKKN